MVCPECGARVKADADVCDLCGAPLPSNHGMPETAEEVFSAEPPNVTGKEAGGMEKEEASGPFCNGCGWHNPVGARYCSMCGASLQDVSSLGSLRPSIAEDRAEAMHLPVAPSAAGAGTGSTQATALPGKQIAIIVGAGVLLVITLFMITVFSRDAQRSSSIADTPAMEQLDQPQSEEAAAPLSPQIAEQVEAFEADIAALDGNEKVEKQRQLVNLLIGSGRMDRAAMEQAKIADELNTTEAWTQAGNLYYDWMQSLQGQQKVTAARLAVDAYQRVLQQDPENLDVRTDMAWAVQFVPEKPMEAITQTNLVLEKDPDHVQANFNKGIFLLQISRLDQAVEQFEKVKQIVGEQSPVYNQANEAVLYIRSLQEPAGS